MIYGTLTTTSIGKVYELAKKLGEKSQRERKNICDEVEDHQRIDS